MADNYEIRKKKILSEAESITRKAIDDYDQKIRILNDDILKKKIKLSHTFRDCLYTFCMKMNEQNKIIRNRKMLLIILMMIFVETFLLLSFRQPGEDWHVFREGFFNLIQGRSPYGTEFFNPPWTLIILSPLALLPDKIGSALTASLFLLLLILASRKLNCRWWMTVVLCFLPSTYLGMTYANVDWMILLGLFLPPQIGLFFVLIKPQIGIGIALFWAYNAYKEGGLKNLLKVFAPVAVAFFVTFFIFGFYPTTFSNLDTTLNISLWPWSLPIAVILFWRGIRKNNLSYFIAGTPFISPYISPTAISFIFLGLLPVLFRRRCQ